MMRYVSMRRDSQRSHKVRKWVWGGVAAGIVLLIGVGITVGILVANNNDGNGKQVSESSSNIDNAPPTISSEAATNVTNAPSIALLNMPSSPNAVPISMVTPSLMNGTTLVPSALNGTDEVDGINGTTSTPTFRVNTTTSNLTTGTAVPASIPVDVPASTPVTAITTTAPAPATSSPTYVNQPTTTIFYAHGDIPYEDAQTLILEEQMNSVPLDAEFLIFVGDLRDAGEDKPCLEEDFTSAAYYFRLSHAPVFVIQGDNDISDCPNYEEGKAFWMREFVGFESKYWNHTFDIQRHTGYPDDFAFVHKLTLFIGLNIIGGDTRNVTEWETRLRDEAIWTTDLIRAYQVEYSMNSTNIGRVVIFGHANPGSRHATYFETMSSFINNELLNTIPIVYINGDKHEWMYTPSFYDTPSWLRVGVAGLGAEPLLRVTVEADGTYIDPQQAFELERFI